MKKRELNLLPEKFRFDIEKHVLIKRITLIAVFNILVLILITVNLFLQNNILRNKINEEKKLLSRFIGLTDRFSPYKKQYNSLKRRISQLDAKKKLYFINYNLQHSPLLSTVILGKCILKGIKITSLEYSNGVFSITGDSESGKYFYKFYQSLTKNRYIKKTDFFYLQKNNQANILKFKIAVYLKKLQ